ncbi:hypothetical protein OIU78_024757 [Salix suchowensis]|nr:hypothetical protein OIU78_024757 [Salix suchowensis]
MTASVVLKFPVFSITEFRPLDRQIPKNHPSNSVKTYLSLKTPRFPRQLKARTTLMEAAQSGSSVNTSTNASMKLLFVEMGVGYDQHGQDITSAAMRACRDAISSNSIPAFRRGSQHTIKSYKQSFMHCARYRSLNFYCIHTRRFMKDNNSIFLVRFLHGLF